MLCDMCKNKKATVHFTEVINDEITELHLCEECAKSRGDEMEQHFSVADLLSELVEFPSEAARRKEHIKIKCPNCGMSYADFKKLGRFGCARCYEAFKRALYPLFKKIHGTTHHIGRQPEQAAFQRAQAVKTADSSTKKSQEPELEDLKARLTKAIANEEFEEAASLRDRIRELEDKLKGKG